VLELIDWLRQLDARFVAAVTSQGPPSETESRVGNVLGAVGIVLAVAAILLLPPHGLVQTAVVCAGLLLAVPYLHNLFERVLVALRA
jgi:hypothetical protein